MQLVRHLFGLPFRPRGTLSPPIYAVCTVWPLITRSPGEPTCGVSASLLSLIAHRVAIDVLVFFHTISNDHVANHASISVLL